MAAKNLGLFVKLPDYERAVIDFEALKNATNEGPFIDASYRLLIEVGGLVCIAANLHSSAGGWSRGEAALGGNLVRLFKFIQSLLDETNQNRRETSFIFARLAFETIINLRFLMKNYSDDLVESYIVHSFRAEKALIEGIRANIERRGGEQLPIETRMIKSVENALRKSGVTLDGDNPHLKKRDWGGKNTMEKADDVGLGQMYVGAFKIPSHAVHGNWYDLLAHHLEGDAEQGFRANISWQRTRPQFMQTIAELAAETVYQRASFSGEDVANLFKPAVEECLEKLRQVSELHEIYLNKD
jgi:hypothetical protein